MKKLLIFAVMVAFVGCSKTQSIQEYYVAKSEDLNFLVIDIPTSVLGINNEVLNHEEQAALDSFQKLNVLMFRKTAANADQFPEELKVILQIIDGEQFESLMTLNDRQFSGKLLLEGSVESPDEIVFFGSASDQGFLLARLIGSKMRVEKAIVLAKALEHEGALENIVEEALDQML
ncbi:MAG: DUF4252 domain-containing protein [Flavobacteriaceae bacterium]|jgi:hypothetical protein